MSKPKETIKAEINSYIKENGGGYSAWYVGIASNPRGRLFNDHNVDEKNDNWIYIKAETSDAAREVEDYFLNTLGTSGGPGGGDDSTKFVYAYKKTSSTRE